MHTVSHLTSYCISSVVTYQLNQSGMVDHDCIAYSNTVEISLPSETTYKQLSLNIMTTLL